MRGAWKKSLPVLMEKLKAPRRARKRERVGLAPAAARKLLRERDQFGGGAVPDSTVGLYRLRQYGNGNDGRAFPRPSVHAVVVR